MESRQSRRTCLEALIVVISANGSKKMNDK